MPRCLRRFWYPSIVPQRPIGTRSGSLRWSASSTRLRCGGIAFPMIAAIGCLAFQEREGPGFRMDGAAPAPRIAARPSTCEFTPRATAFGTQTRKHAMQIRHGSRAAERGRRAPRSAVLLRLLHPGRRELLELAALVDHVRHVLHEEVVR